MLGRTSTLFALDPGKTINQYGHSVWFKQNRLPANSINAGFKEYEAYFLWGTSAGLFRSDGVNFTKVKTSIGDNNIVETISSLCMSKDSNLWIGTTNNDLRRMKDGKVYLVDVPEIVSPQIRVLLESRAGNLWLGTSFGLYKYSMGKFSSIPISSNFITALAKDSLGRIWVGTYFGSYLFDDTLSKQIDSITTINGLPHNMVTSLFTDSRGSVWIGTQDGLADDWVNSIFDDRNGSLWICSPRKGITHFRGNKFSVLAVENGLFTNEIYCILGNYRGPSG